MCGRLSSHVRRPTLLSSLQAFAERAVAAGSAGGVSIAVNQATRSIFDSTSAASSISLLAATLSAISGGGDAQHVCGCMIRRRRSIRSGQQRGFGVRVGAVQARVCTCATRCPEIAGRGGSVCDHEITRTLGRTRRRLDSARRRVMQLPGWRHLLAATTRTGFGTRSTTWQDRVLSLVGSRRRRAAPLAGR